jgi:hypothetical protein
LTGDVTGYIILLVSTVTSTDGGATPVTRVTLRYASAADAGALRRLAELDTAPSPSGPTLVAVVDGRLRAALPLDGTAPVADPLHRGRELLELLRMRAAQLA